MFAFKKITTSGIVRALEKAERYRLLNDPAAAESICLDVLVADPGNQKAQVMLLLARSDQFAEHVGATPAQAREVLPQLIDPYQAAYYAGIIAERWGQAVWKRGRPGRAELAYHALREAMEHFEEAERLSPAGNHDAILRWNTCARLLNDNPQIQPRAEEDISPVFGE
ncbi:MAG: hypothetical protein AABZ01_01805 [Gemmatimonadota bacterium]